MIINTSFVMGYLILLNGEGGLKFLRGRSKYKEFISFSITRSEKTKVSSEEKNFFLKILMQDSCEP